MAQLTQLPANNMGAEARFHADNARRKSSERLNQRQSLDLATESIRPSNSAWLTAFIGGNYKFEQNRAVNLDAKALFFFYATVSHRR